MNSILWVQVLIAKSGCVMKTVAVRAASHRRPSGFFVCSSHSCWFHSGTVYIVTKAASVILVRDWAIVDM